MQKRLWIEELYEEANSAWESLRSFWTKDVLPVLATVWVFFVIAAPLIVVILILWYLDSSGWRPEAGFYTIGFADRVHALLLSS